jgi:hypothetical protein
MSYDSGMGERIKRHSGWRWPVLIALGIALFGAMFLLYYLGPTPGDISGTNPKPTAETTAVSLAVVGVNFTVPSNYLQLPKTRAGGVQDLVEMQALLPDLAPYSGDKADAFEDVTASSKVLNLLLHPTKANLTEQQRLERIFLTQVKDRDGSRADYGLTLFVFQEESGYANQELYVGQDSRGATAVLLCDKGRGDVTAAACRRDIDFTTGLGLSYEFKRGFLPQWKDIDHRVVELVASFRAPTPTN